jgi:hypothetical protein
MIAITIADRARMPVKRSILRSDSDTRPPRNTHNRDHTTQFKRMKVLVG